MKNNKASKKSRKATDMMIIKLRKTFVRVATLSAAAVLLITLLAINGISVYKFYKETDSLLSFIAKTGGDFSAAEQDLVRPPQGDTANPDDVKSSENPKNDECSDVGSQFKKDDGIAPDRLGFNFNAETKYRTRFFFVTFSADGAEHAASMDHIAAISEDSALKLASDAVDRGRDSGSSYPYRYRISENENGETIAVFLDCSESYNGIFSSMKVSILVFVFVITAIFLASILLSSRATRPFEESVKKQKRFITDASHEIKTPLAIISANADVLELSDNGENTKWIESIRRQTARMSSLLRSLTELSKFDEGEDALSKCNFSFSNAVLDTAAEFEVPAAARGMTIEAAVSPDVIVNGDEGAIRHLTAILCDNAVKHGSENTSIQISLAKKGHGAVFSITNKAENTSEKQLAHIFDRFYRTDESRSRDSGGYGIGLSIASSVAAAHKGTINAKSSDGGKSVTITFTIP